MKSARFWILLIPVLFPLLSGCATIPSDGSSGSQELLYERFL